MQDICWFLVKLLWSIRRKSQDILIHGWLGSIFKKIIIIRIEFVFYSSYLAIKSRKNQDWSIKIYYSPYVIIY